MDFRVKLKMKKTTCWFTWIVFIEFNFAVAFQLIRKIWDGRFVDKVGVGGWGVDTPFDYGATLISIKPR